MGNIFNRIQRPSLRQGVIIGLILGGVEIVLWVISSFLQQPSLQSVLSTLILAGFLIAGYIAGLRSSQETGKLGSGVAGGLWSGLIGSVLLSVVPFVFTLIYLPTLVAAYQQDFKANSASYAGMKITDITPQYVLTGFALDLLANIILYALIAIIGGTLGGFLGKRRLRTQAALAWEGASSSNTVASDESNAVQATGPDSPDEVSAS